MYQIAHKKSDGTFINQEAKEKCVSICWWNVEVFGLFIYRYVYAHKIDEDEVLSANNLV